MPTPPFNPPLPSPAANPAATTSVPKPVAPPKPPPVAPSLPKIQAAKPPTPAPAVTPAAGSANPPPPPAVPPNNRPAAPAAGLFGVKGLPTVGSLLPPSAQGWLDNPVAQGIGAATQNTPPLSYATHHLGAAKPVADQALGFLQKQFQSNPQAFAQMLAGLGPDAVRGLLGSPAGLPLLLMGHAALSGGQPLADVATVMDPILKRTGSSVSGLLGGLLPQAKG